MIKQQAQPKITTTLRIDPDVYYKLQDIAKKQNLSLNELTEQILKKASK